MAGRDLTLSLKIIAEATAAVREFKGLTAASRETAVELGRTAQKVESFSKIAQAGAEVGAALEKAKAQARDLGQQLVAVVGAADSLKAVREFNKTEQALAKARNTARLAGEDARNLGKQLLTAALAQDQLGDVQALRTLLAALDDTERKSTAAGKALRDIKADFLFAKDAGYGASLRPDLRQAESAANALARRRQSLAEQAVPITSRLAGQGLDLSNLDGEEQRLRRLVVQIKTLSAAQADAIKASKSAGQQVTVLGQQMAELRQQLQGAGVDLRDLGNEERRLSSLAQQFNALAAAQQDAIKAAQAGKSEQQAIEKQLDRLRQQLSAAGVDTKKLSSEQQRLDTATRTAADAFKAEADALQKAQRLAAARQSIGLVDTKGLKQQADQARQALNELRKSGDTTTRELVRGFVLAAQQARNYAREQNRILPARNALGGGAGVVSSFASSAAAGAGLVGGGYGLVQTIAEVRDATVKFEGYRLALEAVTGTQERANRAIQFTRDLSERLGLELSSTTERYTQFAAATRGTRLEGEAGQVVFEQLASSFAVLGLSAERQSLAFQAVNQILGKSVVQAEELRGQLAESLPGAVETAARALGVTTAKLNELIKTGQVNGVDFLISFGAQSQKELGEKVPDAVESSRAAFGRFSNAITELKTQVGNGGVVDSLTESIESITERIKDPAVIESLTAIGTGIVDAFGFLVDHADVILETLAAIKGASIGSGIGTAVGGTIGLLSPIPGGAAAGAALGSTVGGLIGGGLAAGAVDKALDSTSAKIDKATTKTRDYRLEIEALTTRYTALSEKLARGEVGSDFATPALQNLQKQIEAARRSTGVGLVEAEANRAAANERIKSAAEGALRIAEAANQNTRLRARLEATAAFANAQIAVQTSLINEAERQNLITAEAAIKRRAELQRQAVQNEIALRRAEISGVDNQVAQVRAVKDDQGTGAAERNKQLADLDAQRIRLLGQINALKERERGITVETRNAIDAQREADEQRLNELRGKLAEQNRDAKGVASATLARLQQEYAADLFGPDKARADLVGQIIDTQVTQAEFNTVRQQAQDLVSALQAQFATLSQGVEAGTVGTAQAQQQFAASLASSSPQIDVLLGQMATLAQKLTPEAREQVQALTNSLLGLAISAQSPLDRLLVSWQATANGMRQATATFLDGTAEGIADLVTGGKFQFGDLLRTLARDLASSAIKGLFADLFEGLFKGSSGGSGIFAAIGSAFGFAEGGLVRGPGSGTSDSIPARLSNGEYVIKAASVRKVGTRFLDALNGATMPGSMRAGVPAFASGGLVGDVAARSVRGTSGAPTVNVPISISVPESTSREDSERIARDTARAAQAAVQQVLANEMRPGGLLARA